MTTIVLDVDGVLLNWLDGFHTWISRFGPAMGLDVSRVPHTSFCMTTGYPNISKETFKWLIPLYNGSVDAGYLAPVPGAVSGVKALVDAGYDLRIITCFSKEDRPKRHRNWNLERVFGDVFSEVISLSVDQSKEEWLKYLYKPGDYYVEDNIDNAIVGSLIGYDALLIDTTYNKALPGNYRRTDWHDIKEMFG